MPKLNWRNNWGRYGAVLAMGLGVLTMVRGAPHLPLELAIGIPVVVLLASLPGLYYVLRDRRRHSKALGHPLSKGERAS